MVWLCCCMGDEGGEVEEESWGRLEGTAVAVYAKSGVTADGGEVCTSY